MKTTNDIYVNGKRLRLNPRGAIGKGGEADIYDIGGGRALKLYKTPEHPDFQMQPDAREAARQRLAEQQHKLRQFPTDLPDKVIVPGGLATADASGQRIVGYTMQLLQGAEVLLRFGDRSFRESGGIDANEVVAIFKDLHDTVTRIHGSGVVIGDFNDLNVLVRPGGDAFLIDADSFQFGMFPCRVFTARFVDPILCDPAANNLLLAKPHSPDSDWYAFCVMLMQCLLYVDPYGGLYRPKDASKRVGHNLRPLHRITVFHAEVRYPKPATPYGVLPDDLLHFFHRVFDKDHREPFPRRLLEDLRWTTCPACGTPHARAQCPLCFAATPAMVRETTVIVGDVTATRLFQTSGVILCAANHRGKLRYLFHENGQFKREDDSVVAPGDLDPATRFRVQGSATLVGRQGQVVALRAGQAPERIAVDGYGSVPVFDTNEDYVYWAQAGQLWRGPARGGNQLGPEYIGDVLANQTLFWSGPLFGFGFYRAGELCVAFVFDAEKGGLNDSVEVPSLHGQLINAHCVFAADRCWFLVAVQESGRLVNHCFVVRQDGSLEASTQAEQGDGSWLGTGLHGKWAGGAFLLAPTEDGIVRVEIDNGTIVVTKTFPGTEPFVDAASRLLPGPDGLYVVGRQDIHLVSLR